MSSHTSQNLAGSLICDRKLPVQQLMGSPLEQLHNAVKIASEVGVAPPQYPDSFDQGSAHLLCKLGDPLKSGYQVFMPDVRERHYQKQKVRNKHKDNRSGDINGRKSTQS